MRSRVRELRRFGIGAVGGYVLLQLQNGILRTGVLTKHHMAKRDSALRDLMDTVNRCGYSNTTSAVDMTLGYLTDDELEASRVHIESGYSWI